MNTNNRKYVKQRLLLVAAGIWWLCVKTATSPLERIRVLAQTGNSRGIIATAVSILETKDGKDFGVGMEQIV